MATLGELQVIGDKCQNIIEAAEADDVEIDDGNVVDLCADNTRYSLNEIRHGLIMARYQDRFPKATNIT